MANNALNGRVARLEAAMLPSIGPDTCRTCGLRHVEPLTVDLLRRCIRVEGCPGVAPGPPPVLCLCEPCCADGRWLARLSHGLPMHDDRPAA